jgi:hypothetical protein
VCAKTAEVWQSIKAYCEKPEVPNCECEMERYHRECAASGMAVVDVLFWTPMERYFTPPMVTFDVAPWAAYKSPIDNSVITSKAERNEHMAKHGVVLYDDIAPDIERNRKRIQAEMTADIKSDMVEAIHMVEAGHKPQVVDTIVPVEAEA